ncbi:hypothetical protein ACLMJK_000092 [Lecanora helva]
MVGLRFDRLLYDNSADIAAVSLSGTTYVYYYSASSQHGPAGIHELSIMGVPDSINHQESYNLSSPFVASPSLDTNGKTSPYQPLAASYSAVMDVTPMLYVFWAGKVAGDPTTASSGYEQLSLISRPIDNGTWMSSAQEQIPLGSAGSGGSSAAYYINKFKGPCSRVNITVYERSGYVGGRSTTVDVHGDPLQPVEVGASIFVQVNHNLVSAVNEFGLSTGSYDSGKKEIEQTLGVYNGAEWVFRGSDNGWWGIVKLLWKYGMAPIQTQRLMKKTVGLFLKMYEAPAFPFKDLSQTVYDLGLTEATAMTGKQYLRENRIDTSDGSFATDIIQASTRVNYAQNIDNIHGLETMVCMATDGAMQVKGGNWQIFAGMLKASNAHTVLNTSITSIHRQPNGTYTLTTTSSTKSTLRNHDTIILAAPLQYADLTISPQPLNPPPAIPYVSLHVTLFTSSSPLNPLVFNLPHTSTVPSTILTTLRSPPPALPLPYYSISTLRLVTNPKTSSREYLYKIFSAAELTDAYIHSLLRDNDPSSTSQLTWIHRKLWQSYPYLPPRVTFEDVKMELEEGEGEVWYTSGIEGFISTMETSSLMGMNVARLVVEGWEGEGRGVSEGEKGREGGKGKVGLGWEDKDL